MRRVQQLKNPFFIVLLVAVAGTGAVAWRLSSEVPAPDTEARRAFVFTRRADLDHLRACLATGRNWTLQVAAVAEAPDAGDAPPADRASQCRAEAAALRLVSATVEADGTVLLIQHVSSGGRAVGVAWLERPADRIPREADGAFGFVDDGWYVYATQR